MRRIELAISSAGCSPGREKFSIFVKLHDARIAITVADEECAIGQPGDVGGPLEMLVVIAGLVPHAQRHQKLFAVIGKLEDLMVNVVNHPDVVLGIIRTDQHRMRAAPILEEMVPLRPRFDELALGIDDGDAILEHGHDTCGRRPQRPGEAIEIARELIGESQLATIGDKDFVGRLGKNPAGGSPDESLVGQWLWPAGGHVIRTGAVVSTFLLGRRWCG